MSVRLPGSLPSSLHHFPPLPPLQGTTSPPAGKFPTHATAHTLSHMTPHPPAPMHAKCNEPPRLGSYAVGLRGAVRPARTIRDRGPGGDSDGGTTCHHAPACGLEVTRMGLAGSGRPGPARVAAARPSADGTDSDSARDSTLSSAERQRTDSPSLTGRSGPRRMERNGDLMENGDPGRAL